MVFRHRMSALPSPFPSRRAAATEKANVRLVLPVLSVAVTVIVVAPSWPNAGVIITVRSAPNPPKIRFAFGTSAVFDEIPVRTKPAAPAALATVMGTVTGVLSGVTTLAIGAILGFAVKAKLMPPDVAPFVTLNAVPSVIVQEIAHEMPLNSTSPYTARLPVTAVRAR